MKYKISHEPFDLLLLSACTREMNPVCGNDGQTYNNDCLMRFATCKSKNVITMAYRGKCNATDGSLSQYGMSA